ncbi:MAG TPA: enoyl-CoA hydratase-related protein [Amycolatopsis sp.]|nr:enoyl-CoA hydratase-related protein [Amycolatopsis sp.]
MSENVLVQRDGPVTTITPNRSEARNAVDGPTAAALADAFRAFDADEDAAVAVLTGSGDAFCAGAALKAVGTGRADSLGPVGDGPMGPSRMTLSKPVIAAVRGHAVAGGRADRTSAYGQYGLTEDEAMRAEFSNALIGGGLAGVASRFSDGAGRHGGFDGPRP